MLLEVTLLLRVLHQNPLPSASFCLQRHEYWQLHFIISFYIHLLPHTTLLLHYYNYYINIMSNHLVTKTVKSYVILKVSRHNRHYIFTFTKIQKICELPLLLDSFCSSALIWGMTRPLCIFSIQNLYFPVSLLTYLLRLLRLINSGLPI